jgi:hypothetical protein
MRCIGPAATVLLLSLGLALPSLAGGRKPPRDRVTLAVASPRDRVASSRDRAANPLDRVADAVDGAESSHGADLSMWRPDPAGPQGPMQVSAAAASDVGGGDRFDPDRNREIGRAYLAQLYRRYGDWPDAIAAYNWGIGNLAAWVKAGRPATGVEFGVASYLGRVLHDSGLCAATAARPPRNAAPSASQCPDLRGGGLLGQAGLLSGGGRTPFHDQLDKALRLALAHARSP